MGRPRLSPEVIEARRQALAQCPGGHGTGRRFPPMDAAVLEARRVALEQCRQAPARAPHNFGGVALQRVWHAVVACGGAQ